MFKPVSNKSNFPKIEEEVLEFWKEHQTFKKSLELRKDCKPYTFYDGPPFATGLPHYGHLLASTLKDIIPRYQTMRGHYVERRFGWDCHGLPVELEVEKSLGISGKKDIVENLGIDKFNETCRSIVLRFTSEWEKTVNRIGRWVDFENDYKTMDKSFMESVWWVFKQLWEKGLVYEGYKVLPYSYRLGTPLSNFEANQNYKMVQDPSIVIKFKVSNEENTFILGWTTTPWTLVSNMALGVGEEIDYVKIKHINGENYYVGQKALESLIKNKEEYEVLESFKGSKLKDMSYEPIFKYFEDKREEGAFRVIIADYISEDGTGIVHTAPAFGEDDYRVCNINGVPLVNPVNDEACFTDDITEYRGMFVKDADKIIMKDLKASGILFKQSTIEHTYPFCWRSDTPLIYRAISTWFVKVEDVKDKLVKNNQEVHWVPDHLKSGRFGKWIENARDWAISRNRFWGTPIPVWRTESGKTFCVGSIEELEKLSGQKITDLHMHFIDKLELVHPETGEKAKRIPEVFDCWFESGSMPYAQNHYPFERKEYFKENFPAEFIAEGIDQTRGWFYTLSVLSSALFDKPPAKNIVVNGIVLAEDGAKMSKSKKNYPDPNYLLNSYGADAVRLYMIDSPLVKAEDLRFSETGVKEILKSLLIPLWNSYSFFVTYANVDNWSPEKYVGKNVELSDPLDKWIFSVLQTLIKDSIKAMDDYDLNKAVAPFINFIEQLTNWYIRRSRRRFWKSENDKNKEEAYYTLYTILIEFSKVIAPFLPFISETIYQNLRTSDMPESVHLCEYPSYSEEIRDNHVEERMSAIQSAVYMGRALRAKQQLKIRQPLKTMYVVTKDDTLRAHVEEVQDIVIEELNVKEVIFSDKEENLVDVSAKANFKVLGKKLGKSMRGVALEIEKFTAEQIYSMEAGNSIKIEFNSEVFEINYDDILIQRSEKEGMIVETQNGMTVAIDTELTPELIEEGFAREFVNKIQNMRKEADFEITDKISISYNTTEALKQALVKNEEYIKSETLALVLEESNDVSDFSEWDINGELCKIKVVR